MKKNLFLLLGICLFFACSTDENLKTQDQSMRMDEQGNLISVKPIILNEDNSIYLNTDEDAVVTRSLVYNGPWYAQGYLGRTLMSRFSANIGSNTFNIPPGMYYLDTYKYYTHPIRIPKGTTFVVDVCSPNNIGFRSTDVTNESNRGAVYEKIGIDGTLDIIQIVTFVPVIEFDWTYNPVGPYYYVKDGFLTPGGFCYRWGYYN